MPEENQYYYQWSIAVESPQKEQLIHWLDQLGFTGFIEEDGGIQAFVDTVDFDSHQFWESIKALGLDAGQVAVAQYPYENWNEQWEATFQPQVVNDQVHIRAPFHQNAVDYPYEVIIEPQMAFGTGHHATTRMMIQLMLDMQKIPETVFDFGTGSGILAILAEKMGATHVFGNEIQQDGLRNARQNLAHNQCKRVQLSHQDLANFPADQKTFDLILANINRNTIIGCLPVLKQRLNQHGLMAVSGFLSREEAQVDDQFHNHGFERLKYLEDGQWAAGLFASTKALAANGMMPNW